MASGDDIYVADANSVTEFNASTGALVKVYSGTGYQFDHPAGVIAAGGSLYVSDLASDALTTFTP